MTDYPVMLQLEGRRCVIVGAGPVGLRKLRTLVPTGAEIVLIAPDAEEATLATGVIIVNREFSSTDLDGAALAFAATSSLRINREIADAARDRGIPVNIADDPQGSDFTLPASCHREGLTIAVATGGRSPAAAALVRDHLNSSLGIGWSTFVQIAGELRRLQLTNGHKSLYNQQVLQNLLKRGLIQMIESGDTAGVERLLTTQLADKISLADLNISLPKGAS